MQRTTRQKTRRSRFGWVELTLQSAPKGQTVQRMQLHHGSGENGLSNGFWEMAQSLLHDTMIWDVEVKDRKLYTIGYEGMAVAMFIQRLRAFGVSTLIDVRELPLSRRPGYSKNRLRIELSEAGIAYLHAPMLGCPRDIRHRYRDDNDWAAYTRDFLRYLETQEQTVQELAKFARSTTVCLLCYEADFNTCHRTYVARAAHAAGGPPVVHLSATTERVDRPLRVAA